MYDYDKAFCIFLCSIICLFGGAFGIIGCIIYDDMIYYVLTGGLLISGGFMMWLSTSSTNFAIKLST